MTRGGLGREDVDAPGRVGGDAQKVIEDVDQQQARHEGRHAYAEGAEEAHRVVGDRIGAERRKDAERDRHAERQDQRRKGQLERGRQTLAQIHEYRLARNQ